MKIDKFLDINPLKIQIFKATFYHREELTDLEEHQALFTNTSEGANEIRFENFPSMENG